jgi:hypothetical protein
VFEIEITPAGTCDVRQDRRSFGYDFDDVDDAVRMIRSRVPDVHDDEITVVDVDGYKVPLRNYR